eukprot:3403800-Ditylum_brightwellii.AAC.1
MCFEQGVILGIGIFASANAPLLSSHTVETADTDSRSSFNASANSSIIQQTDTHNMGEDPRVRTNPVRLLTKDGSWSSSCPQRPAKFASQ